MENIVSILIENIIAIVIIGFILLVCMVVTMAIGSVCKWLYDNFFY